MNKRNITKKLAQLKKQPLIIDYVENYSLLSTGNHEDVNAYDFILNDETDNKLILRQTQRGDGSVHVLFMLITCKGKYVNVKRIYEKNNSPVQVYCMESSKQWKFKFDGEVIYYSKNNQERHHLKLAATFNSDEPIIDMKTSLNEEAVVEKLRISKVEQKRFNSEDIRNQVSYHQQGYAFADITIDEIATKIESKALRKHRIGKSSLQNLFKVLNTSH